MDASISSAVPLYLDCNASRPPPEAVRQMFADAQWANPSSAHALGQRSGRVLHRCRTKIAAHAGARPEQLIFTSSGTEANLLALCGLAAPGSKILLSAIEHPSVLQAQSLLKRLGHTIGFLRCDGRGVVAVEEVLQQIDGSTGLVALMSANNETGVLQPIEELAPELQELGVPLHVDSVQSLGKQMLNFHRLGASSISLSGHKVGAPAGIGALILADASGFRPLHGGGVQERGRRAGSHNFLGIQAWAAALDTLPNPWTSETRDEFERSLCELLPSTPVNGGGSPRLPNTSNLTFAGVDGPALVSALSARGVHASTGSACRARTDEPSHVLRAMGLPAAEVRSSLRFSFLPEANRDTAVEAARQVAKAVRELRGRAKPA